MVNAVLHPERIASEAQIQDAMRNLSRDQGQELRRLLGNPPSFDNVPDSFWQQVEDEKAALLLLLIASISGRSAYQMRNFYSRMGVNVSDSEIDNRVTEFSLSRAAEVARGTTETIKNRLQQHFQALESKKQSPIINNRDMGRIFGADQDEMIAQTETTTANSFGEGIIQDNAKQQGMQVLIIWRTEDDSRVCPICSPLDDKPEEVWVRSFPLGPAAHPRCRCSLETIINGVSYGRFLPDIGINPVQKIWFPTLVI